MYTHIYAMDSTDDLLSQNVRVGISGSLAIGVNFQILFFFTKIRVKSRCDRGFPQEVSRIQQALNLDFVVASDSEESESSSVICIWVPQLIAVNGENG